MIIYKITNTITNKIYIGQTRNSLKKRFDDHKRCCKKKNPSYIQKSMIKYGFENFICEEIDSANNIEELNEKESFWIKHLNTLVPNGYNLTTGGEGYTVTEEGRKNIGKASKGRIWNYESKKKVSENRSGEKESMYGKNHTPETKEKISKARTGSYRAEKNTNVKLTWEIVNEIRNRYVPRKVSSIKLAKEYGVCHSCILRIVKYITWNKI